MIPRVGRGVTAAFLVAFTATSFLTIATTATDAIAGAVPSEPHARAAHVVNATDTAHLRYISASGSLLLEEGKAAGTLPGRMRVHLNVGTTFTGTFTIYASGGSIQGHGSAQPHGSGVYESFSGTLTVTGGTGRYAHAHGHGGLYGTFDRNNYALVVKTTGNLSY
jgi:hypothetical protein